MCLYVLFSSSSALVFWCVSCKARIIIRFIRIQSITIFILSLPSFWQPLMFSDAILSPGLFLGVFALFLQVAVVISSGSSSLFSENVEDSSLLSYSSGCSSGLSSAPIVKDSKGSVSLSREPLPGESASSALGETCLGVLLTCAGL